jgi:serine/threonine protein kinase
MLQSAGRWNMIGTRIAHYEITGKLGEGGMGVVYRATDTKLNRDVAIKVLPKELGRDRERCDCASSRPARPV